MRQTIGETRSRINQQNTRAANQKERTKEMPEELSIKQERADSQSDNQHAMADYRRERTREMPMDQQIRIMRAKADIASRGAQQVHQAIMQALAEKRLDLAERTLGVRATQANNRYIGTFGGVPSMIDALTGVPGAPAATGNDPANVPSPTGVSGNPTIPIVLQGVINGAAAGQPAPNAQSPGNTPNAAYLFDNKGLTAKEQLDLINHNSPYKKKTSSTGQVGTYQKPTNSTQTQLDAVQNAIPQLASAMNVIAQGAKYYSTAADRGARYIAAIGSYLSGNPSKSDQDILEKAGISATAMTEAAETLSRVQQLAKTDTTFQATLDMIKPQKGDTAPIYAAKQKGVFDEMKKRGLEAQYTSTMGKPNDIQASLDMKQYVDKGMQNNFFDSIYEPTTSNVPMPQITPAIPNQVGFYGNASLIQSPVGRAAVTDNSTQAEEDLKAQLKEKFPTMSDAKIQALVDARLNKKGGA